MKSKFNDCLVKKFKLGSKNPHSLGRLVIACRFFTVTVTSKTRQDKHASCNVTKKVPSCKTGCLSF